MASHEHDLDHDAVEDDDLDEDDDADLPEPPRPATPLDDEDDLNSPSTSSSLLPTTTPIDPLLSSVTVAVPAPSVAASAIMMSVTPADRKPLFQRLWTDEDEIELLQGFLLYTSQRGGATTSGGAPHPDTSLFYDQIKSKLQLDFNKNQLVEKLRRLKKKYRNVATKISSGKHFSFKNPHDQATFEISRKIWSSSIGIVSNLNNHGNSDLNMDDDDEIVRGHGFVNPVIPSYSLNPSSSPNPVSEIKSEDYRRMATPLMGMSNSKSRKRLRTLSSAVKVEERNNLNLGGDENSVMANTSVNDVYNLMNIGIHGTSGDGIGSNGNSMGGSVEETVRSCLAPVFRELLGGGVFYGGGLNMGRINGIAAALIPLPFGLGGMDLGIGIGHGGDKRCRKQQIMELEVFSKRLELVQEQIKVILEDLRSKGG